MGINTANFIDKDDMDIHEGEGILLLLELGLMDADGEYTEEALDSITDYKKRSVEYNKRLTELYAESYKSLSLWMYQMDKREMFTQEEFLNKARELKQDTIKKREELQDSCFPKEN